jgi:hypothetical protein
MTTYYQVATPKHEALLAQNSSWFVHYKRFETLDDAQAYAVKYPIFQIIKSEVVFSQP